jgi:hypothetical protein
MYEISAESEGVTISHLADGRYAGQLVLKMIFMETQDFINLDNGSRRPRLLPRRRNGPIVVPLDALDAAMLHHPPSRRRFIRRLLMENLNDDDIYDDLTKSDWDKAVPIGIEHDIAWLLPMPANDMVFKCTVDIRLNISFLCYETSALVENCVICLEGMAAGAGVQILPECTHRFHTRCLTRWFREKTTCPACRRDYGVGV